MKDIFVKDIINKCNGKLLIGNEDDVCINFEKDTRLIKKGDVFLGIKGEQFNGSSFYEKALDAGAKTCILQDVEVKDEVLIKYSNRNIIIVEDVVEALGKIAKYKRSLFDIPVIGITGSVGKTSTKDIVASVVSEKYNTLKTEGNMNNDIGLPLTILKLNETHEALVIEMGMNHKGEISYLTSIAKPTVAVITNVGTSHIGNLGSRENILKAKLEILEGLESGGVFVYNNDNDMLTNNKEMFEKYNAINYGIDNKSDLMAYDIVTDLASNKFNVDIDNSKYNVYVPVSGKHFVYNSLCAIAVGVSLNINIEKILEGIKKFTLTKKRMEVVNFKNNITVINDSYNASYDSMKAALEFLGGFKDKYKIAVLGDMLELGKFADDLHLHLGDCVFNNNINLLVTVGEHSKKIANRAVELGMKKDNAFSVDTTKDAFNILKENLTKEPVILLKASNSMKFSQINDELISILK